SVCSESAAAANAGVKAPATRPAMMVFLSMISPFQCWHMCNKTATGVEQVPCQMKICLKTISYVKNYFVEILGRSILVLQELVLHKRFAGLPQGDASGMDVRCSAAILLN